MGKEDELTSLIPNGIYCGLDEEEYHADPALGSTGLKKLLVSPPDYWWSSPLNPLKQESEETPALKYGKAVHKCVLEGVEQFTGIYAPKPRANDYESVLVTADDLRGFLKDKGEKTSGNKPDLIARAAAYDDCPIILDNEIAEFEASGKIDLSRDDYNRVLAATKFIQANNHLSEAFTDGMPEVSVFWEEHGVRLKCRFDYLKYGALVDLKSIGNTKGIDFGRACFQAMANYNYPLSAAHYMNGRRQMKRLYQQDLIYGDFDEQWLKNVVNNPSFAFVFVFWQSKGSPITKGITLSPMNPIIERAENEIKSAIAVYKEYMDRFGSHTAWILEEPLVEADDSLMPAWFNFRD